MLPKLKMKYVTKTLILIGMLFINSTNVHAAHPGDNAYKSGDFQTAEEAYEKRAHRFPR